MRAFIGLYTVAWELKVGDDRWPHFLSEVHTAVRHHGRCLNTVWSIPDKTEACIMRLEVHLGGTPEEVSAVQATVQAIFQREADEYGAAIVGVER